MFWTKKVDPLDLAKIARDLVNILSHKDYIRAVEANSCLDALRCHAAYYLSSLLNPK